MRDAAKECAKDFERTVTAFANFEEHEILEMILYSCHKRHNTNEIAHRLINRFVSCVGVFNASVEELCEVKGVGRSTALTLVFYGELYKSICDEKEKADTKIASEGSRGCKHVKPSA